MRGREQKTLVNVREVKQRAEDYPYASRNKNMTEKRHL